MRILLALIVLATIAAILVVPMHPDHWVVDPLTALVPASSPQLRTMVWWGLEDFGNAALFLPVGAAVAAKLRPWWAPVAVGFLFSVGAEAAQAFIPGRVPSLLDVVLNVAGAAGGGAVVLLYRGRRGRAHAARRDEFEPTPFRSRPVGSSA